MIFVPGELEESSDFDIGTSNIRLSCGERYRHIIEDFEFVMRLADLSDPTVEKSLEFTKETFDLFVHHEAKICKVIEDGLKAIIFQQIEVQLFVWKYDEKLGFQAHFQDKRLTTISMNVETIEQLAGLKKHVDEEYNNYKSRKYARKKKLRMNKDDKPGKKKPSPKRSPKRSSPKNLSPKKSSPQNSSPKNRPKISRLVDLMSQDFS